MRRPTTAEFAFDGAVVPSNVRNSQGGFGFSAHTRFNKSRVSHMQTEQLSYAIVTPYSMRKSRTGSIIARLISRTGLDLVAARMFAPGKALVDRYAETIVTATDPRHRATQELIREYVLNNFSG